jgi:chemotaxis-related protein WspB
MNTLSFSAGKNQYAIATREVIEIVPWVTLRKIPHAPEYVSGMLNYRGIIVPVIDMTRLMTGTPSKPVLSTRIILVSYPGENDNNHILGILAEQLAAIDDPKKKHFTDPGITVADAPYLGNISMDEKEIIQLIRIEALLPDALRETLFTEQETDGY